MMISIKNDLSTKNYNLKGDMLKFLDFWIFCFPKAVVFEEFAISSVAFGTLHSNQFEKSVNDASN